MESKLHLQHMGLLIQCLEGLWKDRDNFFAGGNLTIYYSPNQKKSEDFREPDFFVVLDTQRYPERKSWVVWEEDGKYPNVIVEIISNSTAKTDKEFKKKLDQETFRTPDYFWFDPVSLEFAGFHLVNGEYQPIEQNDSGYLWSEELGLYLGVYKQKLRFFTAEEELVPTLEETVLCQTQQKELAEQQKQRAEEKSAKFAAKLRELNIDPDSL